MNTFSDNNCVCTCSLKQIILFNIAVDDFSLFEIFDVNGNKHCNDCISWSYSIDNVKWSCWMMHDNISKILFELNSDYYVRAKVDFNVGKVLYNGELYNEFSTELEKCFDFNSPLIDNPNKYNPYANMEYAIGLYNMLSETVSNIVGIPIFYFKMRPSNDSKDITFKEYTLLGVESVKQIKMIIQDNEMPSSRPEFSEFGFDFSTDWTCEITKMSFASAFGQLSKPMEGDLVYVPMMKRMWMVNSAYDEKKDGLMWNSTTFKIGLVKYQEKGSITLGDSQEFVDSIVKTKYEDLFGDDENTISGESFLSSPSQASNPLYPVFKSDAIRKYVKHSITTDSDIIEDINAKLISRYIYHKGALISDICYDWTSVYSESCILYQPTYQGTDCTFSAIISFGPHKCKGNILTIGHISLHIDYEDNGKIKLSINGKCELLLEPNKTYFIIGRWSKSLNVISLDAVEYKHPENIPTYLLKNFHYYFDFDNKKSAVQKYDIEFIQCDASEISSFSFDGKITNIKVYDSYIEEDVNILPMLPNDKRLILNDTARKFVSAPTV